jgi:hypothetical protein
VGMPVCVHCGKKVGGMTVLEALMKIVGPGHGCAGRVITTPGSNDYFPPAPTDERVWPVPPKTADLALLHDGRDPL